MTPLEAKMSALMADAQRLLQPFRIVAQKWSPISENESQLIAFLDKRQSAFMSWTRALEKIRSLPSYSSAKEAFERDRTFAAARRSAGHWATFEAIVQTMVGNAAVVGTTNVKIDQLKAVAFLRASREKLGSEHLRFEGSARLIGVALKSKSLRLSDDISIHRLSLKERADRQPSASVLGSGEGNEAELLQQATEIRVPVTVPVDPGKEADFFRATQAAQGVAVELFGNCVQAILLTYPGRASLGRLRLHGGVPGIGSARSVSREFLPISSITIQRSHLRKLNIAYDLVVGGKTSDKTLSRALHRFLLGRQRSDAVDQLVDYVIAWEALLLTTEGNPVSQELSYRFAVNGASLIGVVRRASDRRALYKQMQSAYRTRSSVVHGGTDVERDKALQSGDFKNLHGLCNFLEENFRRSAFWLASVAVGMRPYRAPGGWEQLLWR